MKMENTGRTLLKMLLISYLNTDGNASCFWKLQINFSRKADYKYLHISVCVWVVSPITMKIEKDTWRIGEVIMGAMETLRLPSTGNNMI